MGQLVIDVQTLLTHKFLVIDTAEILLKKPNIILVHFVIIIY
jgi:hypothetical protein